MHRKILFVVLLALVLSTSAAWALSPMERTWDCSEWEVTEVGPAVSSIVDDGCEVKISGTPYTLYSVIQFPKEARYFQEWDVKLESRLDRGALGISIGNDRSGLIFQVSDRNEAEILLYRGDQKITSKMAKTFRSKGKDYVLRLVYDTEDKHCVFSVNDKVIYDIYPKEWPNLPMTSIVQRLAVTTTLPEDRSNASVLHKKIHVLAR